MNEDEIKYKANVAAILRNSRGRILVCERLGIPGAWQFPQGGIDEGETPREALLRELGEEIDVDAKDIEILEEKGPYRYLYQNGRSKRGHHGKEQIYFLCAYQGPDSRINVATRHPEFQAFQWIAPEEFQLEWLPEMKREVYRAVFRDFFDAKI